MAQIAFTIGLTRSEKKQEERRSVFDVLKLPDSGASPRGSTFYKSMLDCPREHGLMYQIGLSPKQKAEALTVGWLFHHGLELYYKHIFDFQKEYRKGYQYNSPGYLKENDYFWAAEPDAAIVAWNAILPISEEPGYADTWKTVSHLLDRYFDRYMKTDRWHIVAIEETLEFWGAHLGLFDYTTRLDLLIHDMKDDRLWNVEHKSAKMITAELIDYYDLDLQIVGQVWTLQKTVDLTKYPRYGGTRVNIVTKHKETQFVRHDVLPSPMHVESFERVMLDQVKLRPIYQKMGWPKSLGHCSGYARGYSKCQFYELCREHPLETVNSLATWDSAPGGFEFKKAGA